MIKTTLGKLALLRDSSDQQGHHPGPLSKLSDADPTKTSFADRLQIGLFLKPVVEALQDYEKGLIELVQKYGDPDPNNADKFIIRRDDRPTYHEEAKKLEAIEVEIVAVPLPARIVEKIPLTPRDLILLEDFVTLSAPENS